MNFIYAVHFKLPLQKIIRQNNVLTYICFVAYALMMGNIIATDVAMNGSERSETSVMQSHLWQGFATTVAIIAGSDCLTMM